MKSFKQTYIALACASVFLAACGGGGGTSTTTPTTLSGTAAAGAALVGNVTIKDANGNIKTVPIGAGGGYTVDVSDMKAPFIIRASGTVGGRTYVIHSVATDASQTVNVTPLTDLIVANIAGQLASNFFDTPDVQKLTSSAITEQQEVLKQRLQTVLTALGVDAAVDLLHTQFSADHTKLDAALDVLRVSIDSTTNTATITNVITQEKITDDLKSKTDNTSLSDTTNLKTAVTDVQAIVAAMKVFSDKFTTALPKESDISSMFDAGFLHGDRNKTEFIAEITSDPMNIGIEFTNVTLQSLTGDIATVNFDVVKNGAVIGSTRDFQMKKVNGTWLISGNQYALEIETVVTTYQSSWNSNVSRGTGLRFSIEEHNSSNSPNANRAVVTGPGLPQQGLTYIKSTGGDWSTYYTVGSSSYSSSSYWMSSDAAISSIPDNAEYTVTVYNTDNSVFNTYKQIIKKRPYTNAELATLAFPTLTTDLTTYAGGPIVLEGTVPTSVKLVWMGLGVNQSTAHGEVNTISGSTNNTFKVTSLTVPNPAPSPVTYRYFTASYDDLWGRQVRMSYSTSN